MSQILQVVLELYTRQKSNVPNKHFPSSKKYLSKQSSHFKDVFSLEYFTQNGISSKQREPSELIS